MLLFLPLLGSSSCLGMAMAMVLIVWIYVTCLLNSSREYACCSSKVIRTWNNEKYLRHGRAAGRALLSLLLCSLHRAHCAECLYGASMPCQFGGCTFDVIYSSCEAPGRRGGCGVLSRTGSCSDKTGVLNLGGTGFNSIASGTFAGMYACTELHMKNYLSGLPSGIFDDLTSVTKLEVSGDGLPMWPDPENTGFPGQCSEGGKHDIDYSTLFEKLTALQYLEFTHFCIGALPPGTFDNNPLLKYVTLFTCGITSLPIGIFDRHTSLTKIYLRTNHINYLPAGIFDTFCPDTCPWPPCRFQFALDQNPITCVPMTSDCISDRERSAKCSISEE